MKRAFSMPAALLGLGAALSAYASTADLWLSFAVYLGLLSLNLAAHGAGAGRGGAAPRHGSSTRGVSAKAAGRERGLARPVRRVRGSFPDIPD